MSLDERSRPPGEEPPPAAAEPALRPDPAAADRRELALRRARAALPHRLQRALDREVGPGERIEAILRPALPTRAALRGEAFRWLGLLTGAVLIAWVGARVGDAVLALWFMFTYAAGWSMRGSAELVGNVLRRHGVALVITDRRCIRMAELGHSVRIIDVYEPRAMPGLAAADLLTLARALADPRRTQPGPDSQRGPQGSRAAKISPGLRRAVERQLRPGEPVLWLGRPTAGTYLRQCPIDAATTLLVGIGGLMSVPLAMLVSYLFSGQHFSPGFTLDGALGLGLTGLALFASGLAHVARRILGTAYVVTDRRAFIVEPGGRMQVLTPRDLRRFQRQQNVDGHGSLTAPGGQIGFFGIADVKDVDDLIKQREGRDRSTEVVPAASPGGTGQELAPGP